MSELTPEQWRELDKAERGYAEALAAIAERGVDFVGQGNGLDREAFDRWDAVTHLMHRHRRTLIDAARPKCLMCEGSGWAFCEDDHCPACGNDPAVECPDCNGTGCAA